MKIGFLGAGNMAEALVSGLLKQGIAAAGDIYVSDVVAERCQYFASTFGVQAMENNMDVASATDVLVLAVKPQGMKPLLQEIAGSLAHRPLLISIAAGLPVHLFESVLGGDVRVIRAMPNTPALVGQGMTAICRGQHASAPDLDTAADLLGAVGEVVRVEEADMDAVTAVSGSGPAYIFYVMEAMLEAASRMGMDADVARSLVLRTVEGAAALALASSGDPGTLRQRVTSKGGTTAAALAVMDEEEIHDHIITAMLSAQTRAQELSKECS